MDFLIKVFLAFFIPIFLFLLYAKRFRNPFKNTFIFGKKGSGKSTYLVKMMLKYQKRGWHIYTDIKDCIIPGVRIIDAKGLEYFTPEYHSCLCLDEVGISFDNRGFKDFPPGLRDWFKFQRKYKVVVFQNSQAYDIDKKIRDCVDSMILQTCIADCIGISRPIYKTVTLTEPMGDAESRIAEKLRFAPIWRWKFMWMPRYHKYFDSFNAPPRKPIPFREVTQEYYDAQRQLRKMQAAQRRRRHRRLSSAQDQPAVEQEKQS